MGGRKSRFAGQTFKAGYRDYLGVNIRSSWENNVLLVLNEKNITWEYEPRLFTFDKIKRGTKSYLPDLWLPEQPGYEDGAWVEIKGYMSDKDKTKMKRFKRYYPDDFSLLQVVTKNEKVASTAFFKELGVEVFAYYDDLVKEYKTLDNWI